METKHHNNNKKKQSKKEMENCHIALHNDRTERAASGHYLTAKDDTKKIKRKFLNFPSLKYLIFAKLKLG